MNVEKFQFPPDWKISRIVEEFDFVTKPRGLDLSKNGNEIPFFPMNKIPVGQTYVSEFISRHLTQIGSGTYVENGTLMVAKITPSFENGKQAIVDIETDFAYATTEVIVIRGQEGKTDTLFLSFYLLHPDVRSDLAGKMEGSTGRQRLSKTVLGDRSIPLPPLPEQKKIAHILSTVQRAIQAQEQIIQTTTELFKAMSHQLMTAQIRVSNGDTKLQQTEIGKFPYTWKIDRVDSVFEIQQGKQVSQVNRMGNNQRSFLRTKNVFWGRFELSELDQMNFTETEELRLTLKPNDLLMCEGGDIGRTALWDRDIQRCYYQNHLYRLRTINKQAHAQFFAYWFWYAFVNTTLYAGRGNVTTIPNLSRSRLAELPMAIPPLSEQKKITHILATIQQKTHNAQSKKSKLETLFRTLLHELMTAKIRVNSM